MGGDEIYKNGFFFLLTLSSSKPPSLEEGKDRHSHPGPVEPLSPPDFLAGDDGCDAIANMCGVHTTVAFFRFCVTRGLLGGEVTVPRSGQIPGFFPDPRM